MKVWCLIPKKTKVSEIRTFGVSEFYDKKIYGQKTFSKKEEAISFMKANDLKAFKVKRYYGSKFKPSSSDSKSSTVKEVSFKQLEGFNSCFLLKRAEEVRVYDKDRLRTIHRIKDEKEKEKLLKLTNESAEISEILFYVVVDNFGFTPNGEPKFVYIKYDDLMNVLKFEKKAQLEVNEKGEPYVFISDTLFSIIRPTCTRPKKLQYSYYPDENILKLFKNFCEGNIKARAEIIKESDPLSSKEAEKIKCTGIYFLIHEKRIKVFDNIDTFKKEKYDAHYWKLSFNIEKFSVNRANYDKLKTKLLPLAYKFTNDVFLSTTAGNIPSEEERVRIFVKKYIKQEKLKKEKSKK